MRKGKRCRDCGTVHVIKVPFDERYEYPVAVELCSLCLTERAKIQSGKEDKLSFLQLIEKIRKETTARIKGELKYSVLLEYKGTNPYAIFKKDYWIEQLCGGEK